MNGITCTGFIYIYIYETTIVYWGYIGITENQMEATIMGCSGEKLLGNLPGPQTGFQGLYIWGLYRDYRFHIGIMEKKMETTI